MKKLLAIALTAMLLLSAVACSGTETDEGTDATDAATEAVTDAATDAATEAATEAETEEETEAPKRDTYNYIDLSDPDVERSAQSLMGTNAAGVHFTFSEGYLEQIDVDCPSWSDDIGTITFKLFKWDTDYDTTVAAEPIATYDFVDYCDNDTNSWILSDDTSRGIEAGEYLFCVGYGVDESNSGVGIWYRAPLAAEDNPNVIEYFFNGKVTTSIAPSGSMTIVIPAE